MVTARSVAVYWTLIEFKDIRLSAAWGKKAVSEIAELEAAFATALSSI
jgi:hypothetical protein